MNQDSLDFAQRRLQEERRRLESLRGDYSRIIKSRFHALRMLWFSLKTFMGVSSPRDRYAAWSSGMIVSLDAPLQINDRRPADMPREEQHLIASWRARIESHPLDPLRPIVSIIIPVYNNRSVTVRCLQSIVDTWPGTMNVQIILVDDASDDGTPTVLACLSGLDYIRNGTNQGFVHACNRGASIARGKYLCFLNNDTVVREAWLDYLVTTAEKDATVGAVGSKLVYPDGRLQEAGNIIWRDGTGWNYGRLQDPTDSRYNYLRDVDYCSGAALLVRRSLFGELGGFSEIFSPAYYEDVDLCFGVRSLGYRVVCQPRSEVVHYEGLTSGTNLSSGTKRFQDVNRPKFREKWAKELQLHFENEPASVPLAARRLRRGSTILIVDSHVPMHDKDAGSARLMKIIRILCDATFNVVFLPDNYAALQPYTQELQDLGVEVLHHVEGGLPMQTALESVLPILDIAWICRPELFTKYEQLIRHNSATCIIYDTIDLHFVRKRREAELLGQSGNEWRALERMELDAANRAEATVVVTESEKAILKERRIDHVYVVPTLHDMELDKNPSFLESSGVLFIGGYNHPPNVDAARWLCTDIMPLVWEKAPDVTLTLLGSNPPDSILAMESNRILVPGFVRDVRPYFLTARLFVAPLRYGAGMNGKVGHALSFRLPTVLTSLAADGFGLTDGIDCLIANNAEQFADAILRLYRDQSLWAQISSSAETSLAPFQSRAVAPRLLRMLDEIKRRTSRRADSVGAR